MPQTCTVCHHTQHAAIDAQRAAGVSLRMIAEAFSVSKSALVRHGQHRTPSVVPVPGHVDQETPRPALAPATAQALRQEIENLRGVIEEYPRSRQPEFYLSYALGIVLKMIDALSGR